MSGTCIQVGDTVFALNQYGQWVPLARIVNSSNTNPIYLR